MRLRLCGRAGEIPREKGAIDTQMAVKIQSRFMAVFCCSLGEGNGNPLQCSCLENPRDGGFPGGLLSMGSHRVGHD